MYLKFKNLIWSSDWNGYEVGYDGIDVVGLYSFTLDSDWIDNDYSDKEVNMYINTENGEVLETWICQDDE